MAVTLCTSTGKSCNLRLKASSGTGKIVLGSGDFDLLAGVVKTLISLKGSYADFPKRNVPSNLRLSLQ